MSNIIITDQGHNRELDLDKGRLVNEKQLITSFDNNALYNYVSIYSGLSKIQTEFGLTPDEDDYLENALNCLNLIKNVHIDLYVYQGITDENGELCLPERAIQIEYVNDSNHDYNSAINHNISQFYSSGNMVPFKFLGDRIVTDCPNTSLTIAYFTHKQDEEGLPLITEEEARACAYWWIYVDAKRKLRMGNPIASNYYPLAKSDKNKAINQARVPQKLSQNLINQLSDILYSRDRKVYNYSNSPIKLA